jgi:hypothetical protein
VYALGHAYLHTRILAYLRPHTCRYLNSRPIRIPQVRDVSQSNPVTSAPNVLTVSLRSNVDVLPSDGTRITLSNFKGAVVANSGDLTDSRTCRYKGRTCAEIRSGGWGAPGTQVCHQDTSNTYFSDTTGASVCVCSIYMMHICCLICLRHLHICVLILLDSCPHTCAISRCVCLRLLVAGCRDCGRARFVGVRGHVCVRDKRAEWRASRPCTRAWRQRYIFYYCTTIYATFLLYSYYSTTIYATSMHAYVSSY